MHTMSLCPQCGCPSLELREVEIRELDSDLEALRPPEKVTEMECKECGWFGSKPHPVR